MHFVNGEVRLRPIQTDLDLDFILEFANSQEIVRHTLGQRFPSQALSVADWINSSTIHSSIKLQNRCFALRVA